MLPVQPILDALRLVYLVQHPVSVLKKLIVKNTYVLHGRREDDDLIDLGHFSEELVAAWPNEECSLAADFEVVDKRFIQIQHEAVLAIALHIRQVWRIRSG